MLRLAFRLSHRLWVGNPLAQCQYLRPFFASAAKSLGNVGIGDEIYTKVSARYALAATATIIVALIFSLLMPIRRMLSLNPIEAMR
ncbi:MAG: hypothetical protein R2865_04125 [Deinococcales bacterium]